MTNSYPSGSPGVPDSSMPTGAPGIVPRRSSYASVVSGTASQSYQQPARSGASSHLLNQHAEFSYDPSYQNLSGQSRYDPRTYDMDFTTNGATHGRSGSWGRGGQLPSFSSAFGSLLNGDGFGGVGGGHAEQFFVPSYLKGSKYVQKLEAAHKAKVSAHKDGPSTHSSQPGSLSTSASSINLHAKMPTSHRGMTYDLIEKAPPLDDEALAPLPSRWNSQDKNPSLEVISDGLEVKFTGPKADRERDHEACAIRADHPMPPQCGIYYFEVTIISRKREESSIGIGFSSKNVPLSRLPGWEPESWAYHGDDGHSFCCQSSGKHYGPPFTAGDIIGCGVNFRTGSAFFTKNGDFLGTAFREIKGSPKLFPSAGMKKSGEHVRVNFGQTPFVFDIDGMMMQITLLRMWNPRNVPTALGHSQPAEESIDPFPEELLPHGISQELYRMVRLEAAFDFDAPADTPRRLPAHARARAKMTRDINQRAASDRVDASSLARARIQEHQLEFERRVPGFRLQSQSPALARTIIPGRGDWKARAGGTIPLPSSTLARTLLWQHIAATDIEKQREKRQIRQEIEATSTAKLAPPLSETELIQTLVLQFLTHEGYFETAKAFANEVHAEKQALSLDPKAIIQGFEVKEDEDAGHRQRIRAAVLDGDVEKALKYTNAYYPNVLKDNEHVYFRLRCRRFIEMIRQGAEMQNSSPTNGTKKTNGNGHNGDWYDDIINHDMELDDHQGQNNNWDRMETEEAPQIDYEQLLEDTIAYGRDLQAEFKDDPRREVSKALEDAFSLMAYQDPLTAKEVSHLLDPSGRVAVAEELNSAILLSLGKSSSAALEQVIQQTTVLLEDLQEGGGPGALVNIDDFIRPKPGR